MSFILDALRKSESERQRESAPTLSRAAYVPPRRRTPRRNWLLIGLLSITVIVLGVAVLFDFDAPISAGQTERLGSATAEREQPRLPARSQLAPALTTSPITAPAPDATRTTAEPTEAADTESATEAAPDDRVLNIADLLARIPALPEPLLEVVAFDADNPERSSAWINGRRLYVGESMHQGVTLAEVMQNSVVLEYQGERFLLRI